MKIDLLGARPPIRPILVLAAGLMVLGGMVDARPAHKSSNPVPNLGGTLAGVTAVFPDAKYPNKPLWKLSARRADAGPTGGNGYNVVMYDVAATLYEKGAPTAYMTSPRAIGDQQSRTIVATGGVFIKSLAVRGAYVRSTLTADQVEWRADKNQITATGHVVYHNGVNGLVMRSPSFATDTGLTKVRSMGAGRIVLPKGLR